MRKRTEASSLEEDFLNREMEVLPAIPTGKKEFYVEEGKLKITE